MAKEPRPKGYPKLKNYKPSQFMLPTSHYDKKKADRAVTFIENLCHTKGKWAGTPFWLLPWQEQLIRDIFGIVKPDGNRQFRTAFVEICKKVGKSELAAAVALYLLYADNEPSAEVYGAAADRQQASIVFDVAKQMVEMSPALMKRSKLMAATKRIVNYGNAGYYQVLSAEVGGKHGFSVSGLVFDEIHTQPNRQLYDVLTKGSSDARQNPLHFIITTAGNDRHSIAFELHTKAVDILEGRRVDPTFYPVVYEMPEFKAIKEKFEKDYDCLVYYGVLTTTTIGQFLSLLFVSHYEEEWEDDRRELKEGYPYAYVWNREEEFGEIGSIQIKMEQGGLVRVA